MRVLDIGCGAGDVSMLLAEAVGDGAETDAAAELIAYYDDVFAEFRYPTALAPNPIIGYTPKPQLIAAVCRKYPQVAAVNLSGQGDTYFIELQDCLTRPVPIYVQVVGSLNLLGLGAAGLLGAEANILPEGAQRDLLLEKARQAETAAHINEWLASPGLRPPT